MESASISKPPVWQASSRLSRRLRGPVQIQLPCAWRGSNPLMCTCKAHYGPGICRKRLRRKVSRQSASPTSTDLRIDYIPLIAGRTTSYLKFEIPVPAGQAKKIPHQPPNGSSYESKLTPATWMIMSTASPKVLGGGKISGDGHGE